MLSDLAAEFAYFIEMLHLVHKFSVTSWFRSEVRNREVSGHPASLHLRGLAVDVVLDDGEDRKAFLQAVQDYGLHYLVEHDHIHVQAFAPGHAGPSGA